MIASGPRSRTWLIRAVALTAIVVFCIVGYRPTRAFLADWHLSELVESGHGAQPDKAASAVWWLTEFDGEYAVPPLVDYLARGGFNPRCDPDPQDLLRRWPGPAQIELQKFVEKASAEIAAAPVEKGERFQWEHVHRLNCAVALIDIVDDWSAFHYALEDAEWIAKSSLCNQFQWDARLIDHLLQPRFERVGAPPLFTFREMAYFNRTTRDWCHWVVNDEIVTWWEENREKVLAPR